MRTSTSPHQPGNSRVPGVETGDVDPAFLEFASETYRPIAVQRLPPAPNRVPRSPQHLAAMIGAAVLVLGTAAWWAWPASAPDPAPMGSVRIESEPAGARVLIGDTLRGATPLTLELPPGAHQIVVQHGDRTQTLTASVLENSQSSHYVTWAEATEAAGVARGGRLQVSSDPPGVVTVDGRSRGTSPVLIEGLDDGEHLVVVQIGGTAHRRTVRVREGETASLVIAAETPPAGIASGWLVMPRTPVAMQIREDGQVLGTTESERILLPVGRHDLEFVSDALGFRQNESVTITAGQSTRATIELPETPVNINAVPWAEVYVNGAHVGQTPIANLPQRLGTYTVEFRHPQYGRRSVSMTVTLKEPVRVSVDMREP
jgi:hypothetical protein